jgi:arabinose-5-phosphate isomerase
MTAVVTAERRVIGVVTDGDLRRAFGREADPRHLSVTDIMGHQPRSIGPDRLAIEAVAIMEEHKINQLPVVDETGELVGALNMHDLFKARVI